MFEIPLNKAIVPVEVKYRDCRKCPFFKLRDCGPQIACAAGQRKDGKNVMFMLVDWSNDKEGQCAEN